MPAPLVLDVPRHEVMKGSKFVRLTRREFQILVILTKADRRPVSLETLCAKLYADSEAVYREAARQNLYRLSKKVTGYIVNIPCVGFKAINCRIGNIK